MNFCFWFPISIRRLNLSTLNIFNHIFIQPLCVDLKTSSPCSFLHLFSIIEVLFWSRILEILDRRLCFIVRSWRSWILTKWLCRWIMYILDLDILFYRRILRILNSDFWLRHMSGDEGAQMCSRPGFSINFKNDNIYCYHIYNTPLKVHFTPCYAKRNVY